MIRPWQRYTLSGTFLCLMIVIERMKEKGKCGCNSILSIISGETAAGTGRKLCLHRLLKKH